MSDPYRHEHPSGSPLPEWAPDERRGEVPVAVVVARGELDGEELMAWMAERVAPHKRLHDVRFADTLPRTPAGKLLRRALGAQPSYV